MVASTLFLFYRREFYCRSVGLYRVLTARRDLTGCTSCSGFANASAITQNVPIVTGVIGAYFPSDTTNQAALAVATNGGLSLARWMCGSDANGATGEGPDLRVRTPDSGGALGVNIGSTTGTIATPIVEDCNMLYNSSGNSGAISFNNSTPIIANNLTSAQNTDNTANGGALIASNFNSGSATPDVSGTRVYGWIVAQPTAPISATVQTQMQRYLGGKMGLTF